MLSKEFKASYASELLAGLTLVAILAIGGYAKSHAGGTVGSLRHYLSQTYQVSLPLIAWFALTGFVASWAGFSFYRQLRSRRATGQPVQVNLIPQPDAKFTLSEEGRLILAALAKSPSSGLPTASLENSEDRSKSLRLQLAFDDLRDAGFVQYTQNAQAFALTRAGRAYVVREGLG
jgi:hypothetical protein